MQTITIYEKDIVQSQDNIVKKLADMTPEEKKNTSCVIFALKNRNPFVFFFKDFIYEFKIDYYKTGTFEGDGFYEYCKVEYDRSNNNYKIYGYYSKNGKFVPNMRTRNGEYDIITLDCSFCGFNYFKGPKFTEGPRKGQYDIDFKYKKFIHLNK